MSGITLPPNVRVVRKGNCKHPEVSDETIKSDYIAGGRNDTSMYCPDCSEWLWAGQASRQTILEVWTDTELDEMET